MVCRPYWFIPGHMMGGIFGSMIIPLFTENAFAAACCGLPTLPSGLFLGGGFAAIKQLGIEALGIAVVMVTVFLL